MPLSTIALSFSSTLPLTTTHNFMPSLEDALEYYRLDVFVYTVFLPCSSSISLIGIHPLRYSYYRLWPHMQSIDQLDHSLLCLAAWWLVWSTNYLHRSHEVQPSVLCTSLPSNMAADASPCYVAPSAPLVFSDVTFFTSANYVIDYVTTRISCMSSTMSFELE